MSRQRACGALYIIIGAILVITGTNEPALDGWHAVVVTLCGFAFVGLGIQFASEFE